MRALYNHMLKVDVSVIWEPEREGGHCLFDPRSLPMDIMDRGIWIKVLCNTGVFEMRKQKRSDKDKGKGGGAD